MVQDALSQWVEFMTDQKEPPPAARRLEDVATQAGEFVNLIRADVKDRRAVRRTVSIPKWMDDKVSEAGLSLSRILQDALKDRLSVNEIPVFPPPPVIRGRFFDTIPPSSA